MGFAEGALQEASPGRAWPELKPWNPSISTLPERIRNWALNQKMKIELKDITPFCELLKKSKYAELKPSEKDRNIAVKEEIRI
jgi:hypothetical protein